MLEAPERLSARFSSLLFLGFLLTPLTGFAAAVLFGILDLDQLQRLLADGRLPAFSIALVFVSLYQMQRLITPLTTWALQHPEGGNAPGHLHRLLHRFSRDFWVLTGLHAVGSPLLVFWVLDGGIDAANLDRFGHFALLQTLSAALVGMPSYLFGLHQLGKLVGQLSLERIHLSLKSRTLLLAGVVPLLSIATLVEYDWLHNGQLEQGYLVTWLALGIITATISLLSIRSTRQALRPFEELFSRSGASTHEQLAQLRPASTDEIGHLTQTLGKVFQRLGDQETHMRAIIDTAAEGIIVVDEKGVIDTFNPAAERLFGYLAQEIRGHHLSTLLPDVFEVKQRIEAHAEEREVEGTHRNGSKIQISLRISAMEISERPMFTCLVADISRRKSAERELLEAESRYRALVETAHDLVWSVDPDGRWSYLNASSRTIYGLEAEDMIGRSIAEFCVPEHSESDHKAFAELLSGKDLYQYETVHFDNDGNRRHLSFNAKAHRDELGQVVQISGTARDITEQKAFHQQLTYQAEHDSLTRLYNRHYFQEELKRTVARVLRNPSSTCALFYIDLDQFKYINDTLGHAAGDRLLVEISQLLASHVRDGDLLARFGGDEFTLLLYNLGSADAMQAAEHFHKLFDDYRFLEDGKNLNVSCSIGVTLIDHFVGSAEEALSRADIACNLAKAQGRNRVHLYDASDSDKDGMAEDMGWASRVRDMLEGDKFQLVYQPIMALNDDQVQDYEVLVRMVCDDGEIILPGGFMPAAERFGLIHSVDRWIIRRALLQLSRLHQQGEAVRFSINLSGKAFEDQALLPMIRELLDDSNVDPSRVCFEITETAAIAKLSAAEKFIRSLKGMGCQFALDDFGAGFSSFAYLKHLPVDKLKIDGSFVQGMADSHIDQAMVQSMNQVAHALGKQTIAEYVENAATLELLRDYGVDYAQGNYIGKPREALMSITRPSATVRLHSVRHAD
ncbi:MAG TPA: bifunctional diguanylate cyclase/phosphodiesterase [Gammaproteobacteria bacterium]|nr:bifunctional diguanylate cyclase/phosphodiesterase [Gammaproteobacteria bacterium]